MTYTQKVYRRVDEKLRDISRPMKAFVQIKYSSWIGYFSTWEKGPIHPNFDWTRSLKWKLYRSSLNYCLSIIRYITSSNVLVGPRQDTWESAPGAHSWISTRFVWSELSQLNCIIIINQSHKLWVIIRRLNTDQVCLGCPRERFRP